MSRATLEREATLLVVSRAPERLARRIASLRRLGAYRLIPRGVTRIADTYFDTTDARLSGSRIALRTRRTGRRLLFTLKAPSRVTRLAHNRSELELPVNVENASRVLRRLRRLGVRADLPEARQLVLLARSGRGVRGRLVPVQVRQTRRLLRDVRRDSGRGEIVAELALDRVIFRMGKDVRLDEVEVEAKGRGTTEDVEMITRELMRRFPREVCPWNFSKLATGKALERLLRRGALASGLTGRHRLKPSAMSLMLAELR